MTDDKAAVDKDSLTTGDKAAEAARFLVAEYGRRVRNREVEPYCLIVARAYLALAAENQRLRDAINACKSAGCQAYFSERGVADLIERLTRALERRPRVVSAADLGIEEMRHADAE